MPARHLPARPNLRHTGNKQRSLLDAYRSGDADALRRVSDHIARGAGTRRRAMEPVVALADAQFVIAREHGFESWPKFARHIDALTITRYVTALTDPVAAFFEAAGPPRLRTVGTC